MRDGERPATGEVAADTVLSTDAVGGAGESRGAGGAEPRCGGPASTARDAPWIPRQPVDALQEQLEAMYGDTAFAREGHLALRALGWEGQGPTIPAGESAVTALALGRDGILYGGTSGQRCHLWRYDPHADACGPYAQVIDLGRLSGMEHCDVLLSLPGDGRVLAAGRPGGVFVHDPAWEVLSVRDFHALPAPPFDERAGPQVRAFPLELPPGQALVGAVWSGPEAVVYAVTYPGALLLRLRTDCPHAEALARISATPVRGPLAVDQRGRVYGPADRGRWFRFDPGTERLDLLGVLPGARGRAAYDGLCCLIPAEGGRVLYGGTADGYVFAWLTDDDRARCLGRPCPQSRVCGLSALPDGRLVGVAGAEDELAHLFVYHAAGGGLRDLGAMRVAHPRPWVVHRVGAIAAGPAGEVFLGEDDRLAHLVIYHPPLIAPPRLSNALGGSGDHPSGPPPAAQACSGKALRG